MNQAQQKTGAAVRQCIVAIPSTSPRKGYMVVSFKDGSRTSGHESTVCFVKTGR